VGIENIPEGSAPAPTFADLPPEDGFSFIDGPPSTSPKPVYSDATVEVGLDSSDPYGPPSPAEKKRKRIKLSKKMQKTMDKLRNKTAAIPIMWFHSMAKEHPEWELDEEEKDILKDSFETVFEVLDIEVQIEPIVATLTSIWWVLGYPICVLLFLFMSKKTAAAVQPEGEETA
jgi:hypothetical protein